MRHPIPLPIQIALLSFALMAMGGARPQPGPGESPPPATLASIAPYHERFLAEGKTYGASYGNRTVTFGFRSFFGSTIGMCSFSSSGRNRVEFSTSAWGRGSDTFKEMLAFHELGHCLLGRGHKNSKHSSGRPESIMNSWLFDQKTYLANRDQYLKELYTAESDWAMRAITARGHRDFGDCEFGK